MKKNNCDSKLIYIYIYMSVCERKKKVVLSFFQVWALITPATSIKQMNEIIRLTGLSLTKHKVVKYGLNVY